MADGIDVADDVAGQGATQVMDGATTVLEAQGRPAADDTGEFLKILSGTSGAPAAPAASPVEEEAKPIVIKGGPRRVVRADGRAPEMSFALGQRRFALSSGHEMFARKKRGRKVLILIGALALLAIAAAAFYAAWNYTSREITSDLQQRVVGTSDYDGALSMTPANDGGYYTVFLVTSTPTDETVVGELADVVMYRTGKQVADATVVGVPTTLYVTNTVRDAAGNAVTQAHPISDVLATQGVSKALQGICDAFGLRLYNVVVCDESVWGSLSAIMEGEAPASSVDPQSLLGSVRSSLDPQGIVSFAGSVGALDRSAVRAMTAPTTPIEANGSILSRGSASSYAAMLDAVLNNRHLDEHGYFVGTQYDEWGNPLLDDYGNPVGALYDENGKLLFDENGYLQFWGQQYDENGNPVGTPYDEWGNPIFDWNGNPYGTQYDENGEPLRDWRGNMVIYY